MTNIIQLFKGAGFFIGSFLMMVLLDYILPPVFEAMEGIFTTTEISGVVYFFIIIMYVATGIAIPSLIIYKAVMEDTGVNEPLVEAMVGIFLFLVMMILTIKGWYWITTFASLSTNGFTTAIFWVGSIIIWLELTLIVPGYMLINATKT